MLTYDHWQSDRDGITARFKILFDGYQKMFDQSLSKSKDLVDLVDILRSMHEMVELYRKSQEWSGFIESPTNFLQDRDRYYCDPNLKLQHISICRHLLSLLNEFEVRWIVS